MVEGGERGGAKMLEKGKIRFFPPPQVAPLLRGLAIFRLSKKERNYRCFEQYFEHYFCFVRILGITKLSVINKIQNSQLG